MIQKYSIPISISRDCAAIANIGVSWQTCWESLLVGRQIFSRGADIIPNWPESPPLAAIVNFPGITGQPAFVCRTPKLTEIVATEIKNSVDKLLNINPDLRVSLLVATSHGDPGPLSTIADLTFNPNLKGEIDSSLWEGVLVDNLVKAANVGLGRNFPGITISAACATSLVAVSYAADRLNANLCDVVLIIAVDTLSRIASVGFNNIGAMSKHCCKPYDRTRDGTTVGEGAVALILAREGVLNSDKIYGQVSGSAVCCDAAHMVEPNPSGVANVVKDALTQASLSPPQIVGIYWHGTGTRQNDKTEAAVSEIIFGERSPLSTSTKGCLGHTMGASGGFNILAACASIEHHIMPHIAGTTEPEYDNLNLALHAPRAIAPGPILITALGFGGINAAVIITPKEGSQS